MSRKSKARQPAPRPSSARQEPARERGSAVFRAVTALAFASAFAAGAHEVVWSRVLGRATGNTTVGVGLALTGFMLGNGAGALLIPRLALWRRPRSAYAACELVIAVSSAALVFYCLGGPLPSALLQARGSYGLLVDVAAAVAVLLPASIAMGATYPLLVSIASEHGTAHARAPYAAGLAGVVLGTLCTAGLLAPAAGLDGAAVLACAMNLALALLVLLLLPRSTDSSPGAPSGAAAAPQVSIFAQERMSTARFAAAGFLGLAAQAVWQRALLPYAGVSVFTFAGIVAAYVLGQALGFAVHARLRGTSRAGASLMCMAAAPALTLAALGLLSLASDPPSRDADGLAWMASVSAVVLAVVFAPACLLGISQAGALDELERHAGDAGKRASVVAGLGTLIAAIGALGASVVGLPLLGPRATIAAASLPVLAVLFASGRRALAGASAAAALALLAAAPGPAWFLGPGFDDADLYHAEHGVQDTLGVIARDLPVEPRTRRIVSSGVSYSGDSIYAQRYMRLLAHLPALAARGEQRALLICIGTGTTLDALRSYDYARIDAVDISPSVTRTLAYFAHANHGAHEDPRVRMIVDDGARFLRRSAGRYDVITLEPPPPRAPGAAALYSSEFYASARARLAPGGVLAQWLPLHGMSGAELAALVRTFARAFETTELHLTERNEAVLLGFAQPQAPAQAAHAAARHARLARPRVQRDLAAVGYADRRDPLEDTLALSPRSVRALVAEGPVVRDAWPMPEYAPLAGANSGADPPDAFMERVGQSADAAAGSFAALLLPAVPPFLRIERGAAQPLDHDSVVRSMRAWLARAPGNPYVQHAFGFGPLLEQRLERVAREVPAAELERVRQKIAEAHATHTR